MCVPYNSPDFSFNCNKNYIYIQSHKSKIKDFKQNLETLTEQIQKLVKVSSIDISNLSSDQVVKLGGKLKIDELQSYIDKIKEIQNVDLSGYTEQEKADFDTLQIQEYDSALNDVSASQAALLLSTQGLTNAQIAETLVAKEGSTEKAYQAMVEAGLLKSKQALTSAELQNVISTTVGNKARTMAIASALGLTEAEISEGAATVNLSTKKLEAAITSGLLTKAEAEEIAINTGVAASQTTIAGASLPKLLAGIKANTVATYEATAANVSWMLSNPAGWIMLAVGAITTLTVSIVGISKRIEKVKQETIDAGEEAESNLKNISSSIDNTNKKIKEASETYEKLIDGVDTLNNVNISLSDEDYQKFLDTNNEIAELLPNLVSGYDSNGNAILDLGKNAEDAANKLNKMADAQLNVNSSEMQSNLKTAFDGIYESNSDNFDILKEDVNDYINQKSNTEYQNLDNLFSYDFKTAISGLSLEYGSLEKVIASVKNGAIDLSETYTQYEIGIGDVSYNKYFDKEDQILSKKTKDGIEDLEYMQDIVGNLTGKKIELRTEGDFTSLDLSGLSQEDFLDVYFEGINKYDEHWNDKQTSDFNKRTEETANSINSAYQERVPDIIKILENKNGVYSKKSTDVQKQLINGLITNFDYASNADLIKTNYGNDIVSYFESTLLQPLDNIKDASIIDTYTSKLFEYKNKNKVNGNINDLQNIINNLSSALGGNVSPEQIIEAFELQDVIRLNKQLSNSINKFGDDSNKVKDFTKDFNAEQAKTWLDATSKTNSADEAIRRYQEQVKINEKKEQAQKLEISTGWDNLSNPEDESLKNTQKDLLELAESGQLTEETFHKTLGADTWLDGLKTSLPETIKWINELVESSSQLEFMGKQLSGMSEALATKSSKGFVDASTLSGFDVSVKGLDTWDTFEKLLGNSESSMEDCQKAANDLATEYVNSNNFLSQLTDANKEYYITQLDNMGVANAEEVVMKSLQREKEASANAELFLVQKKREGEGATYSLANATAVEIQKFAEETGMLPGALNALLQLALRKRLVNGTTLDFSGDIANIKSYVMALNGSVHALSLLQSIKSGKVSGVPAEVVAKINAQAQKDINNVLNINPSQVKINAGGGYNGGGGDSGSTPTPTQTEETKTLIDWMERRLNVLQTKTDRWANTLESALNPKRINKYYNKLESLYNKQMKTNFDSAERYLTKANSISLSPDLRDKVINMDSALFGSDGNLRPYQELLVEYGEKTAKSINEFQDYYDKYQNCIDGYIEATRKLAQAPAEKASKKLEIIGDSLDVLDAKIDSYKVTSYKKANKDIKSERKLYKNELNIAKTENKEAKSNLNSAAKALGIKNPKKELDLTKYEEGSQKYKQAVAYNEMLSAYKTANQKLEKARAEYRTKMAESYQQQFDTIQEYYNGKIQLIESKESKIQQKAELIEAKGMTVTSKYYANQIKYEKKQQAELKEEQKDLKKKLNQMEKAGYKNTKQWYDMKAALDDVNSSLNESKINVASLNNSITELANNWLTTFKDTMHKNNDITDWSVSLMDMKDQFDSETGLPTDEGLATLGSYVSGYNVDKTTADKISKTIEDLEKHKANGDLSFIDVNEKQREYNSINELEEDIKNLYSDWRDEISSTYEYESKVIDFMRKKYETELDMVKKIIDAKKDELNAEKDLRSYKQSITESTSNISSLKKQIAALQGDNSEENIARIQKLQKELVDAQKDLEDKEYDKRISDEESMLDMLYEEYSDRTNAILQETNTLLKEGLNLVNGNLSTINDTINLYAGKYGYKDYTNDKDKENPSITTNPGRNDKNKDSTTKPGPSNSNVEKDVNVITSKQKADLASYQKMMVKLQRNLTKERAKLNKAKTKKSRNSINDKIDTIMAQINQLETSKRYNDDIFATALKNAKSGKKYDLSNLIGYSKDGEDILTPVQTKVFAEQLVPAMGSLIDTPSFMQSINIPQQTFTSDKVNNIEATYNFTLENCNNAEDIIRSIQNNKNVQSAIQAVTTDRLNGGSRLGVNRIK